VVTKFLYLNVYISVLMYDTLKQAGELEGSGVEVKFKKVESLISMSPGFRRNGVSHDDAFC
jgi:hypothetical protein